MQTDDKILMIMPIIILGWVMGALVNYLSDVLPVKRRLAAPFCLSCQDSLTWMNYLIWPRRCQKCGKRRALRVWFVEFVFAASAAWIWFVPPDDLGFGLGLVLLAYLGVVIVVDIEHRLILNLVSIAGVILGGFIGIRLHGIVPTLLGGLAGYGSMLALYWFGLQFVRIASRLRGGDIGEEEGIGFGDVNLSGVLGLILGWPGIVGGLVLAILLGGTVSLLYLLIMIAARRYRSNLALPYGPFLAGSAIILLYLQNMIARLLGWQ